MEDTLREGKKAEDLTFTYVLILVLMEDTLRVFFTFGSKSGAMS